MKQSRAAIKLSPWASYLVMAILVLLPFHAVFTTWAGSNFGHLDAFRLWKEALMIPLGGYAAWVFWQDKQLQQDWSRSRLIWCIALYTLLFEGFAAKLLLSHQVTTSAILYSLITNLRFLWFMLVVWVISSLNPMIRRYWAKLVLVPAAVVIGFGLLQRFILPADVLRHLGYGPNTIPAVETVDQKIEFRRIQSTLRGANPLGAYLILPLVSIAAALRRRQYLGLFLLAGLVVLFFSYSRSALVALVVAVAFFVWHNLPSRRWRQMLVLAGVAVALLLAVVGFNLRRNQVVQNTLFHTDQTSQSSVSSNAQRTNAWRTAASDIWHQPLGGGPGTAGPASVRNKGRIRLSENYFLQIGQEVGVVGIVLFAAINLLVVRALWRRTDLLSRVLLASFVGITLVNLVLPAWTDDTISLLWWGLAGAALSAPGIIKNNHDQTKNKR